MTGFGRGSYLGANFKLDIDAKAINHRYCDINIRLPYELAFLEHHIRKIILSRFSRGHFDVWVKLEWLNQNQRQLKIDFNLTRQYLNALTQLQKEMGISGELNLGLISQNHQLFQIVEQKAELGEEMIPMAEQALRQALDSLEAMRIEEGQATCREIGQIVRQIQDMLEVIHGQYPKMAQDFGEKLARRIREMSPESGIPPDRLAQEVVIFAERCDIREELIRLSSHLNQLQIFLQANEAVGKKLDFLIQEMNREINTIGSKVSDMSITRQVIEIKSALEKIREQVQNVE